MNFKAFFLFFAVLFCVFQGVAQDATIDLGNPSVAANEFFTITISINNERIKTHSNFPDIPGFLKRGTSSSASTNIINGKMSFSQSITQNYVAEREGKVVIKPFSMNINDQKVTSNGGVVAVGPAKEVKRGRSHVDPFEDFFGRGEAKEYVDVKADAFFALTTNKEEIYVGEGITATLAFYVAAENRAEMQFYDLGTQMTSIIKKIKPAHCWEENFSIEEIQKEPIVINNKSYTQYKLYQAVFYPLNNKNITFPSVDIKMLKYKIAKNPSFFGENRQEDFAVFETLPRVIKVKDLPPHPLKDIVSVGNFRLDEKINKKELETGEDFDYIFKIIGEGNISGIKEPTIIDKEGIFELYDASERQQINRGAGRVTGWKTFNWHGSINEPGIYNLSDRFQWIYFNPQIHRYDTLKPNVALNVTGDHLVNQQRNSIGDHSFFSDMDWEDDKIINRDTGKVIKYLVNGFILFAIIFTVVILFRNKHGQ